LDTWERERLGDIKGDATNVLIDAAAFNDMGSEGHFVVHVMHYVMQFAGRQDRRDD
jgi:hypothetical protein